MQKGALGGLLFYYNVGDAGFLFLLVLSFHLVK